MTKIKIRLFGAFRKYVPEGIIVIPIDNILTAKELKKNINTYLIENVVGYNESSLVFESAIATDAEIIQDDTVLNNCQNLALLPPVCGG